MNPALKGALAAVLVVVTGPIGLIAVGVYYLRKSQEEQKRQTHLLTEAITSKKETE